MSLALVLKAPKKIRYFTSDKASLFIVMKRPAKTVHLNIYVYNATAVLLLCTFFEVSVVQKCCSLRQLIMSCFCLEVSMEVSAPIKSCIVHSGLTI